MPSSCVSMLSRLAPADHACSTCVIALAVESILQKEFRPRRTSTGTWPAEKFPIAEDAEERILSVGTDLGHIPLYWVAAKQRIQAAWYHAGPVQQPNESAPMMVVLCTPSAWMISSDIILDDYESGMFAWQLQLYCLAGFEYKRWQKSRVAGGSKTVQRVAAKQYIQHPAS